MASSTIPNILQVSSLQSCVLDGGDSGRVYVSRWWIWTEFSCCLYFTHFCQLVGWFFLYHLSHFFPCLLVAPVQQKRWPRKSWCLFAHFPFFSHKDGNSSHGESDGALTEASGQPNLWYSGCFLMCSHSSFNLSSSFSVSSSLGLSFTLEPTLLGLSSS